MEMKDLIKKKESDLHKLLKDKREAHKAFRFGMSGTKTRNVKEGNSLKKDISQILTELGKRRRPEALSGGRTELVKTDR